MSHLHQPYCRQLLLECDDPIFGGPLFQGRNGKPTKKGTDLESRNSEDAVTWSVFRLLERHFSNLGWLSGLLALSGCEQMVAGSAALSFWEKGYPPRSRLLWLLEHLDDPRVASSRGAKQDPDRLRELGKNRVEYRKRIKDGQIRGRHPWVLEGPTEFDLVMRAPGLLVALEAKLFSDVSSDVRWDSGREQITRVIDAGRELTTEGDELAFLLVTDRRRHDPPKRYEALMAEYMIHGACGLSPDKVGWLTWGEIFKWLSDHREQCSSEQKTWIDRLELYLAERSLLASDR
jgi:hypothetical protein